MIISSQIMAEASVIGQGQENYNVKKFLAEDRKAF
jgi:hypothetical protein